MAHLTKPQKYNIQDSNIALLGSDLEKRVREHAGDTERAWENAGQAPGVQIWRIEDFHVIEWPKDRYGSFYNGDSYIVLHTYKKSPESESFSYDLHFWLGEDTSQDEAGTAAYKTVELDDHLLGRPIQYREIQGFESERFLSYFSRFLCLHGGVSSGFHHVARLPGPDIHKLYRISLSVTPNLSGGIVREVPFAASSLVGGDVYVLDKGNQVWQLNTRASAGKERFKAAGFVQMLASERQGQCDITVYDEGGSGAGIFLSEFGNEVHFHEPEQPIGHADTRPTLFRVSDSTGSPVFEIVTPSAFSSLRSEDAFLLDDSKNTTHPTVYVWIGKDSSLTERRLAIHYAQKYLYGQRSTDEGIRVQVAATLVRINEGDENEAFLKAIRA